MNVNQELQEFRESVPGCQIAALIDLSTSMILSSSTSLRVPQEDLDALAVTAEEVLAGPLAQASLGADENPPIEAMQGIVATVSESVAFLRGAEGRNEVLACICTPDTDLTAVFSAGRDTLATILSGD